jgi:hypothetical protein
MGDFDVKSLSSYNKVEAEPSEGAKSLSPDDLKNFRELAKIYRIWRSLLETVRKSALNLLSV